MTVLQRKDARGFEKGPIRKYVVGAVMAAVGVVAAFGLSQFTDQDTASVETGLTTVERNAITQGKIESMERVDRALIERLKPATTGGAAVLSPAAIEQARAQAMVDHYASQWGAGANESKPGPR